MATRSTIKIEGIEFCKIYKHWDGRPAQMIDWLSDFNKYFTEKRGVDSSYKFAQCLRFAKENEDLYRLDKSMETGWGVVKYHDDCGEDYEYTLNNDGTVSVCDRFQD